MKKQVFGIDLSKDKIDFCLLECTNLKVQAKGEVSNNKKDLGKWLDSVDLESVSFSMEHTGHYGALLSWLLSERKATYYMINPLELKRSLGLQRGKTDAIDAYRIASYSVTHFHKLSPYSLPCLELRKLKTFMTTRERYVKTSVQIQNSIKALKILDKATPVKELLQEESKQLKQVKATIRFIEKQMNQIIKASDDLDKTYQKISKVVGVGPITAIKCITETENFTKFENGRKFSCHCGLAPFKYQSGSSINGRTKTHYLRDRTLKAILFKAAGSEIQHDPQLKKYYTRKVDQGKHKLTVLNAVANKLVLRIFAVANRDEPFVKLIA